VEVVWEKEKAQREERETHNTNTK